MHIIIVGLGYAGQLAAARVRQQSRSARLTLVEPRSALVPRIRLHEAAAGASLPRQSVEVLARQLSAAWRRERALEVGDGWVRLAAETLRADAVIYAVGSDSARRPPGLLPLDSEDDAQAIASGPQAVAVVGGGVTALELCTELAAGGRAVVLVAERPFVELGAGKATADAALARAGVRRVAGRAQRWRDGVLFTSTGEVPCGQAVWAGGFAPPPLARDSGLPVHADGRLRVDTALRVVGCAKLLGAGDAAACDGVPTGCVSALPMGAVAGDNAVRLAHGEPLRRLSFRRTAYLVSLGPGRGMAVGLAGDQGRGWQLRGRLGWLAKRAILGFVAVVLWGERRLGRPLYRWPEAS